MEREYSEVIEELRRALRLGDRIEESVLNEGIRYLENALSSILSRSKKHKYQSQLSHLLSIRARYEKRGSGLSDDEVRIKWEDVKSAFLCRIRTGQIVNFKHKDATAFLEDAFTIFEERIKEALAEHSMIKVNVELAAEYMTLNKDGEVIFGSYGISRSSLGSTSDQGAIHLFVKFMEDQRLSFRFIDSFKFMSSSLDNLAKNLKQQPTLRKVFGQDYDSAQIDLLTKKGVFPYEYISSLEKLQETALPPPEQFYSSLTDSDISTKDYEDAKEVWGSFKISNLDSEYGYILEVDLEYPESLHDSHKDLPLCPEHACPPGSKQRAKLLTTLKAKHKYVIHYRSLQQAIRLGVQVTKVHRALKFKQGPWLKSYIDLNTEKRKNSNNDFEKQQYKLCNNAIFGKTMENVRKRIDVKLVSSWDGRYGAEAQISKPNFHSRAIFDENLVAIQLSKTSVTIDKPVYVGFSILDISKTQLYRFHYDFMRDRFGSNCKVLYTDTDSLVYEIRGQNVYEVMKHKDKYQ
ncbi:unnamed protein product [Trichogramma brassicae]|uniref:DNA-directed DNA polymerase n=1 Tax=Trichogramma brassicae TaxID=86971 RepID=A0A6H5I194_9HYME|nr:unnamed protein product [Trichogramma brassicae]